MTTICFVCYDGLVASAIIREYFKVYLEKDYASLLSGCTIVNAGIRCWYGDIPQRIKNADIVVPCLSSDDFLEMFQYRCSSNEKVIGPENGLSLFDIEERQRIFNLIVKELKG